jgi:small subunit ribosomal protein S7
MIKAFNLWNMEGITVSDPGLQQYVCLEPKIVPRTGARYAGNRFHKSKTFIVERFMNKIMNPSHKSKKHLIQTSGSTTGKGNTAYKIMLNVLKDIEKKLSINPIKVLVQALENAAPREEIITIEYGGARYPKAVESAPQRRIDITIRYMTQGAYQKSFNTKRSIVSTLTDEIINAYNMSPQSVAIAKKNELERQADSSR